MKGGWKGATAYTSGVSWDKTVSETVEGLLSQRAITKAQARAAFDCSNPRVTTTGELWVDTANGRRTLLSRDGSIALDYKR